MWRQLRGMWNQFQNYGEKELAAAQRIRQRQEAATEALKAELVRQEADLEAASTRIIESQRMEIDVLSDTLTEKNERLKADFAAQTDRIANMHTSVLTQTQTMRAMTEISPADAAEIERIFDARPDGSIRPRKGLSPEELARAEQIAAMAESAFANLGIFDGPGIEADAKRPDALPREDRGRASRTAAASKQQQERSRKRGSGHNRRGGNKNRR